ncbi:hypothetical protein M422DRAFT_274680 [Sphaerobolus stellatus SS14]|uniref:Uncharacterized protein n=1 Tax=Sphaerobolus stellatus (strain SS14) TaxID=990650 RepID=A0A0C9U5Y0_SPHS4|nr:hypothetical protein M422DRAFT_274680 [Sphaerobolus stellatus SS14]
MRKTSPHLLIDFSAFVPAFQSHFSDADAVGTALCNIKKLKQIGSCINYAARLRKYAAVLDLSDTSLMQHFRRDLKPPRPILPTDGINYYAAKESLALAILAILVAWLYRELASCDGNEESLALARLATLKFINSAALNNISANTTLCCNLESYHHHAVR